MEQHLTRVREESLRMQTATYGHSADIRAYLTRKYDSYPRDETFDPWISDPDRVPFCESCRETYLKFKANSSVEIVEMDHSPACLWQAYFVRKIHDSSPDVRIRLKGTRSGGESGGKGAVSGSGERVSKKRM